MAGAAIGVILLALGVVIGWVTSGGQPQAAPTATVTVSAGPDSTTSGNSPQPGNSSGGGANVLYTFSGNGNKNSPQFVVNAKTVTAKYSYDCSAAYGSSGLFSADLISGNSSGSAYDDLPIANALGKGGSETNTLYPQHPGANYHLEVSSECSWSITLTNG